MLKPKPQTLNQPPPPPVAHDHTPLYNSSSSDRAEDTITDKTVTIRNLSVYFHGVKPTTLSPQLLSFSSKPSARSSQPSILNPEP